VKQFGRFTLFKKLATGGMAEIWLARLSGLAGFSRFVVIKKILSHLAEEETFIRMFQDEARMSAQLMHPNIVQVYDLGEAQGTFFIEMEYIAGENLAAITWRGVKRQNRFCPAFAARAIADACKALHYAHHLRGSDGTPFNIVHRDISPQNLLITYEGEVKVVDFGIAKAATKSQHTKTGMLKGKFSYMSPEQCRGGNVDMRSDIFALGIVLYELCTGKRLFKHESELMILEMITQRRVTPPSDVSPEIPAELESVIMRALEKDPKLRFQTAQDMQIALEDYLRIERAPSTNADIAEYMRALFSDKMEEKQQLCRIAAQDDFLDRYGPSDEEPTDNYAAINDSSSKRRIVYGRPSDVRVSGITEHSSQSYPGTGSQFSNRPPTFTGSGQSHLQVSQIHGQPAGAPWATRIIIVAIILILTSGAYVASELFDTPDAPPPPAPVKSGKIELDSVPSGGLILVNGQPVKLENGRDALTPIEQLEPLFYGQTYKIEIILAGYEPYTETITMGADFDKQLIRPKLVPILGKVVSMMRGEPGQVRIFINNEEVGYGALVEHGVRPGKVTVGAKADDYNCKASPANFIIKQGQVVKPVITCEKIKAKRVVKSGSTRRGSRSNTKPRQTGCVADTSVPPGFATIVTIPFSEVYYRGKKLGETPLNRVKLPSGCNELTFVYGDGKPQRKKKKIKIVSNQSERYRIKL